MLHYVHVGVRPHLEYFLFFEYWFSHQFLLQYSVTEVMLYVLKPLSSIVLSLQG